MRTLKFRIWDMLDGKMYPVSGINFDKGLVFVKELETSLDRNGCKVMQYTGLEDKNNTEIFEGDILETEDGKRGEVRYRDGRFQTVSKEGNDSIPSSDWKTSEISGHVFLEKGDCEC